MDVKSLTSSFMLYKKKKKTPTDMYENLSFPNKDGQINL